MRKELVDDFKAAGITVTKMIISNTLSRSWLNSCSAHKVLHLKKTHVHARRKFANKYLDDPEEG